MRGPCRGSLGLPEQLLLLLQGVEQVDGGGLLQAVGLEGRQHVDKLQEDLPDAHRQQVLVTLPSRVQRVTHTSSRNHATVLKWAALLHCGRHAYAARRECYMTCCVCIHECVCVLVCTVRPPPSGRRPGGCCPAVCVCVCVCVCYVRVGCVPPPDLVDAVLQCVCVYAMCVSMCVHYVCVCVCVRDVPPPGRCCPAVWVCVYAMCVSMCVHNVCVCVCVCKGCPPHLVDAVLQSVCVCVS